MAVAAATDPAAERRIVLPHASQPDRAKDRLDPAAEAHGRVGGLLGRSPLSRGPDAARGAADGMGTPR